MQRAARPGLIAIGLSIVLWAPAGAQAADTVGVVSVEVPAGAYELRQTDRGSEPSVEGYGWLLVPGKPRLPARIFAIAVPPGAVVTGVRFETGDPVVLPGRYDVPPTPLPDVIGPVNGQAQARLLAEYDANHAATYGVDDAYPSAPVQFVRQGGYRNYNLADVRVMPFAYHPVSGRLVYHGDITVHVDYTLPASPPAPSAGGLPRTERVARDILLNYEQAQPWYPRGTAGGRGLHDFVIITLDDLTGSVQSLVDWETAKGRTVEVVTLSWIILNYTGYDLAERIRNFLRDKYPAEEWGIEDVLLVGHYDDVVMRRTAQDTGYGQPETDYYYAELSLPDSQSWDANGNHQWGEDSDPIDFYNEVNVGRIPWSDPQIVEDICLKSVAYEQNDDPAFKKNILLLGAFFWPDTDNAVLMETIVQQPHFADWTMTRLYEQGYSTYPMDYNLNNANTVSVWSAGQFAFVDWAGHGSPTSSHIYYSTGEAFIQNDDCPALNDAYPAIIFADACSNSDTDSLNIGQAMLQQGGVGFLGATKVAYGNHGWNDPYSGSSQSLDYFFTSCVTSGEYTIGQAQQWALREMYTHGLWYYTYYEMFEWGALWGNPNLGMAAPPALRLSIIGDLPDYVDPGVETPVTVQIVDGMEAYVPGSGLLHFRTDEGAFDTYPLVEAGDGLYQATLPGAGCDDAPQFYFSAEGDGGTLVTEPFGAPDDVFTYTIGELVVLFHDDFEEDEGWVVSGDALDGMWERGVPVGGGVRGDPPTDYDGSGQCYLTDNEYGNSDVDDGYTFLDSPIFDLSDGDAEISYALWYTNDFGADPENDLFKTYISDNGGATWTVAEIIGPESSGGWNIHSFAVGDFVTPGPNMRVRFEASDLYDGSVVEAGIDAFFITRLHCEEAVCPEDVNGDGVVNVLDLLAVISAWGQSGVPEDVNGDGIVDVLDMLAVISAWGPC